MTSPEQPGHEQSQVTTLNSKLTGADNAVDNTLVVTRNGKVVFRSAGTNQPADETRALNSPPLWVSPEISEQHLVTRVEPEYPEQARKNGVQGPVVLDAWVGKDGTVQKLTVLSGNPELARAATQAVQQWRFRSFLQQGQPQEVTTRITVVFRLP
jgi:TonB family protein